MSLYIASDGSRWDVERIDPPVPTNGYDWQGIAADDGDACELIAYASTREDCIYRIEAYICERLERNDEVL